MVNQIDLEPGAMLTRFGVGMLNNRVMNLSPLGRGQGVPVYLVHPPIARLAAGWN